MSFTESIVTCGFHPTQRRTRPTSLSRGRGLEGRGRGRCQLRIVQHRGCRHLLGQRPLVAGGRPRLVGVELVPQRGQRRADRGEEQGPRSLLGAAAPPWRPPVSAR